MNEQLRNHDWNDRLRNLACEEAWLDFREILEGVVRDCFATYTPKQAKRKDIYMTKRALAQSRQKRLEVCALTS